MQVQLTRTMLIAAVAILYALVVLPLPYLILDHYSAIESGDAGHSDIDVHAWLEWIGGSSLSGTVPTLLSVLVPLLLSVIPFIQVFTRLLAAASYPRGPPALVSCRRTVPIYSFKNIRVNHQART